MKKAYSKPEIMFEDFSLSVNVAAGCETKLDNQSQGSCGYLLRTGATIFISNQTGCSNHVPDDGSNGICYHVPTETSNLFNS